jgi:hypothetical protein
MSRCYAEYYFTNYSYSWILWRDANIDSSVLVPIDLVATVDSEEIFYCTDDHWQEWMCLYSVKL